MAARIVVLALAANCLCGCSALILASGENERYLVPQGATYSDLIKTLGEPLKIEELSQPIPVTKFRIDPAVKLQVTGKWSVGENGQSKYEVPTNQATEKAYYRYIGTVQGEHDVGEAVSVNLMTFGLAELFLAPAAMSERSSDQPHLFTVWFDQDRLAIAYKRERVRFVESSADE